MTDLRPTGPAAEPVVRPAPHRWLWYALGGRLPARNRGWVLHDTTTGTWWLPARRPQPGAGGDPDRPGDGAPAGRMGPARSGRAAAASRWRCSTRSPTCPRPRRTGWSRPGTPPAPPPRTGNVPRTARQQRESDRKRAAAAKRAARYRDRTGR